MAWQEVETDVGTKTGLCKYSVSLKDGGARVSVPKAAVDKLGWDKATRLRLLIGAAEIAGKLRLEPTREGKITGRPAIKGGGLLVRLGRWPALAPRDVDAVSVDYEIDGDALVIDLPAHAQAVAPTPRPAASIMGGATPAQPAGQKRDVTAKFFDDPKAKQPVAMASGVRGR